MTGEDSAPPIHVLIVEDSDDDAELICRQLRHGGLDITFERVDTETAAVAALSRRVPDVVISDYNMPTFRAENALRLLRDSGLDVPFILVSGTIGEETAAAMMKAGAHDFLLKGGLARLVPIVQRELREAADRARRRRAERALRASEERFRLLAEHAQDIIFRCRLTAGPEIEYVSPAITPITGYRPEDFYADQDLIRRLVEPADLPRFDRSWRRPDPQPQVIRWRNRDDQAFWVEQRTVGIRDAAGRLTAIEGVLRDVTAQTIAGRERENLERQLRQKERMESLGQLAGGVAHDFNNLLSIIIGYADLMLDSVTEEQRADLEGIQLAARRGASLTRQLLIFSRRQPAQPEIVNLNEVVTETDRLLRRTIGEDIDLVLDLKPGVHPILIDRSRLEQIMLNLVVNARAAMPDGGRLTITTGAGCTAGAGGRRVRLTVADTGVGMTPEVAERAFEPFFTTRAQGEGAGLGLATVYGAVTEAGGEVSLHTVPEGGTTFHIDFPAATAVPSRTARGPEQPLHGNGETILLVEDDDNVRGIARRILTSAGYQVLEAAAPAAALTISQEGGAGIDALLTDIIMPGMSGLDLARLMLDRRPELPILFMTGYADPAILDQAVLTASTLLRKPFTAPELLRGLRKVLDTV